MINQEGLDYTYRSQYLKNIEAPGNQSINLYGNDFSNQIGGTNGNNTFIGYGGEIWNGTLTLTNGDVPWRYENGKQIKQ